MGRGYMCPLQGSAQSSQGCRRLCTTGAGGAQQASKQAAQAAGAAQSGGKGAASAAYGSLPQQVSTFTLHHLWYTLSFRAHRNARWSLIRMCPLLPAPTAVPAICRLLTSVLSSDLDRVAICPHAKSDLPGCPSASCADHVPDIFCRCGMGMQSKEPITRCVSTKCAGHQSCRICNQTVLMVGEACMQARKMLDSAMHPGAAQKALSMQVESFWQRHGNKVLGLGAAVLLYVLWYAAAPSSSQTQACA